MPQRARHRTGRGRAVVALAALAVVGACVPPGADTDADARDGLAPSFAAEPTEDATADDASDASDAPGAEPTDSRSPDDDPGTAGDGGDPDAETADGSASPSEPDGAAPTAAPTAEGRSAITDPSGDVEPGRVAMSPPDHADLVGATVDRDGDTFTLRIDLGGGAPDTARDDRHTMNVASFYDVDGDGAIDYEVWANLSSTGWGTSQFDNRAGTAAYGADDDVAVEVVDGQLVLTFPADALGGAERFRWALAAEWGTYGDLQLGTMSRDLAPDDHQPARFPG